MFRRFFRGLGVGLLLTGLATTLPLNADQTSSALPKLFEQLADAEDPATAALVEGHIWQEWLIAPDAESAAVLRRLTDEMQQRNMRDALSYANELVEMAPEFAEAWNKRATLHYLIGDDDRSVADIRETLALEPRHFGAISGLGMIFLRQGNLEAARDAFEQVLTISPSSENARRSAARVSSELGREI